MIKEYFALLCIHWIADFIAQTHWQASNKSKNWNALSRHILNYTIILTIAALVIFTVHRNELLIISFGLINGILHFATDAITSRITAYCWEEKRYHDFFVVIGFDQLVHQGTLLITMVYFFAPAP